ncbi:MAG: twin-arginine translocase TatA/TatE family subunit [Alphaproteobacteria bacterium]|nr:twin-arginine translocase TatA/TatE family subunit [Alphaproteobacteria bacterium]
MSLGLTEIALILIVVLVLFGGKRIPELAKALGKAQYEYKKAKELLQNEAKDLKDTVEKVAEEEGKKSEENKSEK